MVSFCIGLTRSMKRTPVKWSYSWRKPLANKPLSLNWLVFPSKFIALITISRGLTTFADISGIDKHASWAAKGAFDFLLIMF